MSKLYVGNLPSECNEAALRQLFQEHGLACTTILVKRGGYAFVDCCDQSTADRAIDKLNGENHDSLSLKASRDTPAAHLLVGAAVYACVYHGDREMHTPPTLSLSLSLEGEREWSAEAHVCAEIPAAEEERR